MTVRDAVDYRLVSGNHKSLSERFSLILSKKIKLKRRFKLNRFYHDFLIGWQNIPKGMLPTNQELVNNMADDLDELVNQVMVITLEMRSEENLGVKVVDDGWIEYNPNCPGQYPKEYGKYLCMKRSKVMQFYAWGQDRFKDISDKDITHFRKIYGPYENVE